MGLERLSKRSLYYGCQRQAYEEKYHHLRKLLLEITRTHPGYEYRRTNEELKDRGVHISQKVVERLNSFWDFSAIKTIKCPKESAVHTLSMEVGSRVNLVAHIKDIEDFEVLYAVML